MLGTAIDALVRTVHQRNLPRYTVSPALNSCLTIYPARVNCDWPSSIVPCPLSSWYGFGQTPFHTKEVAIPGLLVPSVRSLLLLSDDAAEIESQRNAPINQLLSSSLSDRLHLCV